MIRNILRDPSLMNGHKVVRKDNVVTVGEYEFVCSSVDTAKKLDCRLSVARFAWGMTTRGQAKSREHISVGSGKTSATGWTQHN